jgi:starch synthase
MYAANYGAIPITHDNFIDRSIFKPYNLIQMKALTMIFNKAHTQEFYNYILEAIKIFDDKEKFNKIIDKTRSQKFSWDEGAKEYKALYTRLIKGK